MSSGKEECAHPETTAAVEGLHALSIGTTTPVDDNTIHLLQVAFAQAITRVYERKNLEDKRKK